MELYTIVWSFKDTLREPEWTDIVAKDLTYEQAEKLAYKYMLDTFEEEAPNIDNVWYNSVPQTKGLSGKKYIVRLEEVK